MAAITRRKLVRRTTQTLVILLCTEIIYHATFYKSNQKRQIATNKQGKRAVISGALPRRPFYRQLTYTKSGVLREVKAWTPGEVQQRLNEASEKGTTVRVAIGIAITSKKVSVITAANIENTLQFFRTLVPSFCLTRSLEPRFIYKFYVAYDYDDSFFADANNRKLFTATFNSSVERYCTFAAQTITSKLILCNYTAKPAWSQNDAMQDAYLDGFDYYYRLNDDVTLISRDWTNILISKLKQLSPTNVGMVTPTHNGSRPDHYEFDFVHRTHIEIFGFYYPRVFLDLYADDWIAKVYSPNNCQRLSDVRIVHTEYLGKRYDERKKDGGAQRSQYRINELKRDKITLNKYRSKAGHLDPPQRSMSRLYVFSLWGDDPEVVWGAITNVVRAKIYMPAATALFFTASPTLDSPLVVRPRVKAALSRLGAKFKVISNEFAREVPPQLWKYLMLDNGFAHYAILRDVRTRLNNHDKLLNSYFEGHQGRKLVFTVREGLPESAVPLEDNRISFRGRLVGKVLEKYKVKRAYQLILDYCRYARRRQPEDVTAGDLTTGFLQHVLWPRVKAHAYCFDNSLTAARNYCLPMPAGMRMKRDVEKYHYVGRQYDAHDSLPKFLFDSRTVFSEESGEEL